MLQKIKDGMLIGVGIVIIIGFSSISYAAFTWVTQSDVSPTDTLTASAWNEMIANQNYLKQEVESKAAQSALSTKADVSVVNTKASQTSVNTKLTKSGDTMGGVLNMGTNKVTNLATPTANTDAATKAYADSVSAAGGIYQATCASGSTGYVYCIRINTSTGLSNYTYTNNNGATWYTANNPY